jgi:hypothetical protein
MKSGDKLTRLTTTISIGKDVLIKAPLLIESHLLVDNVKDQTFTMTCHNNEYLRDLAFHPTEEATDCFMSQEITFTNFFKQNGSTLENELELFNAFVCGSINRRIQLHLDSVSSLESLSSAIDKDFVSNKIQRAGNE